MPNERHLVLQLHELLTFLNQRGVVSFLVVAQHGLVGSGMTSPVDTSYLADTVIMLRYFEALGRLRRAISVVKKRSGRHEDTLREFNLSPEGIQISEPIEDFQGVLAGVPTIIQRNTT
jgi:circadian clock protein KaiC